MRDTWDAEVFRARLSAEVERYGAITALAAESGVSRSTLHAWIAGSRDPRLGQIASVARVLGCTLDYLSGRVDDRQGLYSAPPTDLTDALAKVRALTETLEQAAGAASAEAGPGSAPAASEPEAAGDLADALEAGADRRDAERRAPRGKGQGRGRAQAG